MNVKYIIALVLIGLCSVTQWVAWAFHYNGQVFAFTSLIIGAIVGSLWRNFGLLIHKKE